MYVMPPAAYRRYRSSFPLLMLLCAAVVQLPLRGQMATQSGGSSGSSRAVALPASALNQNSGAVTAQQSPGGSGVNAVSSSVQVGGGFAGSVPMAIPGTGPIPLSLSDAVKRGLTANLGPVVANDSARAARANRLQALSALLPNISANLSETVTQVNLAAYGFQFHVPANFGFSIPSVVGPFSYSQAQGALSQSIYDPVQRRNWQAAKEGDRASVLSARDARELVVLAVGGTYLQLLYAEARVESQRAQTENARAIYQQAEVRKSAGTNSKIDVMRSLVELQTEEQRSTSLESDVRKQKLALARVVGLPLDRDLVLSDHLTWNDTPVPQADTIMGAAYQKRADLQALEAQVRAAELALSAARAERLPSASVNGDYGVLGPNPTSAHGVFAVTGTVNIPIWQGGRVRGDIEQAEATLHQRQAELADQRTRVEQDVRDALIEVETAKGETKVASSNRSYATETLSEARDRFAAGVATTVEVVQAQEQVAAAESDYISSLFSYNLASLSLARATGSAETELPNLLKGTLP